MRLTYRTRSCLALGLLGTIVVVPQHPAPAAHPLDLLGKPFPAALARLGVPEQGRGTSGCVQWLWRDDAGGVLQLSVHDELVVRVDVSRQKGKLGKLTAPATGSYPSQPVSELLERLGNPAQAALALGGAGSPTPHAPPTSWVAVADVLLVYADVRLHASAGRVLGPEPQPAPSRMSGPR
jgi:hypothetical protein